ncbi:MAG: atpF1 [Rickettsiaceae bacterium]|jgi:F-type H+-transporting ATPase subunit b|nr:atpF1 [Rickettsiaceae bacterium]
MEFDQGFWVAFSFVLFVALVFKPAGKFLTNALDERAARIKNELGEALRLKEEAQALLASYQRRQREAAEEAESIIKEAEAEAKRITKESEIELESALNKRIEIAMQKIANYESLVIQEVKIKSIDIAINTVRAMLTENINKDVADELIGKAVADMGKKLH